MTGDHERYLQEVLITEDALKTRIAELGKAISSDYQGCPNLLLVCVLKGGVMFLADLMRHIKVPHAIEFLAVSSYGVGDARIPRRGSHRYGSGFAGCRPARTHR